MKPTIKIDQAQRLLAHLRKRDARSQGLRRSRGHKKNHYETKSVARRSA